MNPLYWPARHEETLLATAIYKFHPSFANQVEVWWGRPGRTTAATSRAAMSGDRQRRGPDRHERAHLARAITQLAVELFAKNVVSA